MPYVPSSLTICYHCFYHLGHHLMMTHASVDQTVMTLGSGDNPSVVETVMTLGSGDDPRVFSKR